MWLKLHNLVRKLLLNKRIICKPNFEMNSNGIRVGYLIRPTQKFTDGEALDCKGI